MKVDDLAVSLQADHCEYMTSLQICVSNFLSNWIESRFGPGLEDILNSIWVMLTSCCTGKGSEQIKTVWEQTGKLWYILDTPGKERIVIKMVFITRILYSSLQKFGVFFNYFWSILGVITEHVGTMFQAEREHVWGIYGEVKELVGRGSSLL